MGLREPLPGAGSTSDSQENSLRTVPVLSDQMTFQWKTMEDFHFSIHHPASLYHAFQFSFNLASLHVMMFHIESGPWRCILLAVRF